MQVSVVIPNFNGKHLLQKNLPSVIKVRGVHEVVVVDDGSTDGSAAYVKKNFPRIKLIEKMTNSGFATTVNLGVKAATGDIVVLLNSDAIPRNDVISHLLPHFTDPQVGAVGCLDESMEKEGMVMRGRGLGHFSRGFLIHRRGEVDQQDTLWVSGGSGAFRRTVWEDLGGMDSLYDPFYWEDIDLSYRILKGGYSLVFEPKARVEHRHGEGVILTHYKNSEVKAIAYRNQIIFIWKNITDVGFLLQHLLWLPYHLFTTMLRVDAAFWRGLGGALLKLPAILKKRRVQLSKFRRSDREILRSAGRILAVAV